MYGIGARDLGRGDDRRNVKVAAFWIWGADANCLVGEAGMQGIGVDLAVHGDSLQTTLAT